MDLKNYNLHTLTGVGCVATVALYRPQRGSRAMTRFEKREKKKNQVQNFLFRGGYNAASLDKEKAADVDDELVEALPEANPLDALGRQRRVGR